jgi:putative cardiolipin synthase
MLPGASLGRLHAKTAVIDQSTVYIGSVNLDPRSESTNTELGLFAGCPELAKEVIRVINISKLQSSYRLRFAPVAKVWNGWRRMIRKRLCFPRSRRSHR